jgi:hypothetical protein
MLITPQLNRSTLAIGLHTHVECINFIRATIAEGDRVLAAEVSVIGKPCGGFGYADRGTI